jgi:DNA-binding NarL/FixJ family response regulator
MVVDDHPVMCEGLVRLIDETGEFTVCGQAGTISKAVELIDAECPDLVILDITLGNQNALELIKDIKMRQSNLPILVHSMHDELAYAQRSLRAGARGYLMKHEPTHRLLEAIRHVWAGEIYLSKKMTRQLLHRVADSPSAMSASPLADLTDRELDVFQRLGQGQKTSDIARDLHLSIKTVQTYCAHLKEKLQVRDAAGLVRFAVQSLEAHR